MIFESFECEPGNLTSVIINNCIVKSSTQNRSDLIDISIHTTIVKPLPKIYLHVAVYYKYQVYKKIPIDLFDDACAWLNGKKQSFAMELIYSIKQFMKYDGDREMCCPLKGNFSIEVSKIPLNKKFPLLPLMPSGQYLNNIQFF